MPKAIFEFDLPEENYEYTIMSNASNYFGALVNLSEYLKSQLKYAKLSKTESAVYEKVREEFYRILGDNQEKIVENF